MLQHVTAPLPFPAGAPQGNEDRGPCHNRE
jgi:hypothetical protein